jgi:DNA polymerase-4
MHAPEANSNLKNWIIHFDMDAFFASVEIRDNPELKNGPVAVGGSPYSRGVICTSNYIARKFGVRSALPTKTAFNLCPDLKLIQPRLGYYEQISQKIFALIQDYSESVEAVGVDEGYFTLVSETPEIQLAEIQEKIFHFHGLTASFGAAQSKFLAKIASDWNKPNGLKVIRPQEEDQFVALLPLNKIPGVGPKTMQKLLGLGIKTCGEARQKPLWWWQSLLGKWGSVFWEFIHARDNRQVTSKTTDPKRVSVERTFSKDIDLSVEAPVQMISLVHRLLRRAQPIEREEVKAIEVKITLSNFKKHSKRKLLKVSATEELSYDLIVDQGLEIVRELGLEHQDPIRLLGIGFIYRENHDINQLCLFPQIA